MMRRLWLLLPAGLLGPALLAALWLAAGPGHERAGAVYTVREVQTGLARDPAAWLGRTVRVRGVVAVTVCAVPGTGALCSTPRYSLRDPDPRAVSEPMDVTWGPGDPLLTFLRRVPPLGTILPAPQEVRWAVVATYRVRIRALDDATCGEPCYQGVLLDATP